MSRNRTMTRLAVTTLDDRIAPSSTPVVDGTYAVGADEGEAGTATVFTDGVEQFSVTLYGDDFTGGVRVAMADVTGDGVADLVTAPGPGIDATVKVFDGATQAEVASFLAYEEGFTGGAYVSAGDLNGDGMAEVVTGADEGGGPRVRVFDGAGIVAGGEPTVLADFLAIEDENFRGGVRLGLGDINGDGVADLLVGAGRGGGPRVAGFDGAALGQGEVVKLFSDFFAYEPGLRDGCNVSVGDVDGDGTGDLIFGGGPGGAPRVRVADGEAVLADGGGGSLDDIAGASLADFFAGNTASREGVRVGVVTLADGTTRVVGLNVETGEVTVYEADGEAAGEITGTDDSATGFFGCNVDGDDDSMDAATTATTANQTAEPMAEFEEVLPRGGRRLRR